MYFYINDKSYQADKCVKSRIMTKIIDFILSIDTFEPFFCVIGMLKSPRLKDHMKTIGVDQSFRNRASFENKVWNKMKRYINMLVSVMTKETFKIFMRLIWFILHKNNR